MGKDCPGFLRSYCLTVLILGIQKNKQFNMIQRNRIYVKSILGTWGLGGRFLVLTSDFCPPAPPRARQSFYRVVTEQKKAESSV
jgi:hypothetical protein